MRLAAACVFAASIVAAGIRTDASADSVAAMRLIDMDGRVWSAGEIRGRVALLDFWATWCAPCLVELPYLKRARAQYSRDELEIIGVSFDVLDRRGFVSWINRRRVDWPQVFDGRGRHGPAARQFGVTAVPTSFLIDAEGKVVGRNLRGEQLLAAIDAQVRIARARSPLRVRVDAQRCVTSPAQGASTQPGCRS